MIFPHISLILTIFQQYILMVPVQAPYSRVTIRNLRNFSCITFSWTVFCRKDYIQGIYFQLINYCLFSFFWGRSSNTQHLVSLILIFLLSRCELLWFSLVLTFRRYYSFLFEIYLSSWLKLLLKTLWISACHFCLNIYFFAFIM